MTVAHDEHRIRAKVYVPQLETCLGIRGVGFVIPVRRLFDTDLSDEERHILEPLVHGDMDRPNAIRPSRPKTLIQKRGPLARPGREER
jgi:hypothetical protein